MFFGGKSLRSFKVLDVNTAKKIVTTDVCYNKQHVYAYLRLFSR